MKDIVFGAILFALAGLMFFAVVSEWGTLLTLLIGGGFVAAAAVWLMSGNRRRDR